MDDALISLSADELSAFEGEAFAISAEDRRKAAADGTAMGDGSYPIRNSGELESAVRTFPRGAGNGKTKVGIKRHILKRAREMKMVSKLPDTWKAQTASAGLKRALAADASVGGPNWVAPAEDDLAVIIAAAVAELPIEQAQVPEGTGGGVKFKIPLLLPTGIDTGDRRKFADGGLTSREFPIPLFWQKQSDDGHKQSVIVGRIDNAEPAENGIANAVGEFDTGPDAQDALRLVRGLFLRGVSADVDKTDAEMSEGSDGKPEILFKSGRLTAATLVGKPAFAECQIELPDDKEWMSNMATFKTEHGQPNSLVAAGGPVVPPRDWFTDPGLTEPTHLTVQDDGRVFGHIAAWGTKHIGMPFVTPPKNSSGYKYFATGQVKTDGGLVDVGQLTLAGGHADLNLTADMTVKHYDDTDSAVADVAIGEDQFGIWVAGAARPDLSDRQMRAFRASDSSGDWRPIDGNLELVAALQVNCAGFPIPRARTRVASGAVTAMVAAGAAPVAQRAGELTRYAPMEADAPFVKRLERLEGADVARRSAIHAETEAALREGAAMLRAREVEALVASARDIQALDTGEGGDADPKAPSKAAVPSQRGGLTPGNGRDSLDAMTAAVDDGHIYHFKHGWIKLDHTAVASDDKSITQAVDKAKASLPEYPSAKGQTTSEIAASRHMNIAKNAGSQGKMGVAAEHLHQAAKSIGYRHPDAAQTLTNESKRLRGTYPEAPTENPSATGGPPTLRTNGVTISPGSKVLFHPKARPVPGVLSRPVPGTVRSINSHNISVRHDETGEIHHVGAQQILPPDEMPPAPGGPTVSTDKGGSINQVDAAKEMYGEGSPQHKAAIAKYGDPSKGPLKGERTQEDVAKDAVKQKLADDQAKYGLPKGYGVVIGHDANGNPTQYTPVHEKEGMLTAGNVPTLAGAKSIIAQHAKGSQVPNAKAPSVSGGRSAKQQRAFQAASEGDPSWLSTHGFVGPQGTIGNVHVSGPESKGHPTIAVADAGKPDQVRVHAVNGNGQSMPGVSRTMPVSAIPDHQLAHQERGAAAPAGGNPSPTPSASPSTGQEDTLAGSSPKARRAFFAAKQRDTGFLDSHGFNTQPGDVVHSNHQTRQIAITKPNGQTNVHTVNGNGQAAGMGQLQPGTPLPGGFVEHGPAQGTPAEHAVAPGTPQPSRNDIPRIATKNTAAEGLKQQILDRRAAGVAPGLTPREQAEQSVATAPPTPAAETPAAPAGPPKTDADAVVAWNAGRIDPSTLKTTDPKIHPGGVNRTQVYKGRDLKVTKGTGHQAGYLNASVNGHTISTPIGRTSDDAAKHLTQLQRTVDDADSRPGNYTDGNGDSPYGPRAKHIGPAAPAASPPPEKRPRGDLRAPAGVDLHDTGPGTDVVVTDPSGRTATLSPEAAQRHGQFDGPNASSITGVSDTLHPTVSPAQSTAPSVPVMHDGSATRPSDESKIVPPSVAPVTPGSGNTLSDADRQTAMDALQSDQDAENDDPSDNGERGAALSNVIEGLKRGDNLSPDEAAMTHDALTNQRDAASDEGDDDEVNRHQSAMDAVAAGHAGNKPSDLVTTPDGGGTGGSDAGAAPTVAEPEPEPADAPVSPPSPGGGAPLSPGEHSDVLGAVNNALEAEQEDPSDDGSNAAQLAGIRSLLHTNQPLSPEDTDYVTGILDDERQNSEDDQDPESAAYYDSLISKIEQGALGGKPDTIAGETITQTPGGSA